MFDRAIDAAAWIKSKREGLGLTQRAFAELLGMPESGERTVRSWENSEHVPSTAILTRIKNLPDLAPFRSPYAGCPEKAAFTFIDLFAGIGGIRLPFQEKGGCCVFTSEWDKFSKKTYAANFGEVPHGDITKIRALPDNDDPEAEYIPPHDVLLAGFPCQAFSQAGLKQGFYDTRGTLFFEIQRILAARRPKAFLLENVKQLRGHDMGRTLQTILAILRGEEAPEIPEDVPMSADARASLETRLNYRVNFRVLKASNFGVPQNRERIYIVGFDKDQVPEANERDISREIFDQLEEYNRKRPLGRILEDSAKVDPKYTISDRLLAGHERRLKEHKAKGNGFGFSLFNADSPATNTISARYYKDGSEILIDQSHIGRNPRKLTPLECSRLQGFPKKFVLDAVSDVQNYRQFGNSVSVPVIRAIAAKMKPFIAG